MADKDTGAVQNLVGISSPFSSLKAPTVDYSEYQKASEAYGKSALDIKKKEAEYYKEKVEPFVQKGLTEKEKRIDDTFAYLEKERPYPKPTKENFQDFASMFSMLSALTFAIGGKGRGAGMAGLSALNGAIEGWNKGRKDLFDRNMKEFEKQLKLYEITSKQVLDKLKEANKLGDEKTAAGREALMEARMLDQGIGDAYAKQNKLKSFWDVAEMRVKNTQALSQAFYTQMAKNQAALMATTGGSKAFIYAATGKVLKDDKAADQVADIAGALKDVKRLRERLKDPDIQTGVFASIQPLLQRARTALDPFRDKAVDEGGLKASLDQAFADLDPNDKSVLFIKDAIIAAFKIEQGLVGTRVPVFTQRVLGPVLDPRQYTREAYDALLRQRETDLYGAGRKKYFNEDEMDSIMSFQPQSVRQAAPTEQATQDLISGARAELERRQKGGK